MVSSIETLGLRVETIFPQPYMININVNSEIKITFNSELRTSTIIGNFTVLNDVNLKFVDNNSLNDSSEFSQVEGNVSYKDKSVIFTPTNPFAKNTRYLICVKANGIKDILGNTMLIDYIGMFYTETTETLPGCNFISPAFGSVLKEMPKFTWTDQNAKCYSFQISKEPTFEILLYDVLIKNITIESYAEAFYTPSVDLLEGLYYARVRALNGDFGEIHQIFIKDTTKALVSTEDEPEGILLSDASSEIEVLYMFPSNGECNVDIKTNIFYIKAKGKILKENINFLDCFVVGDLADMDEADTVEPHGYLKGDWTVVYDIYEDVSYVIFTPIELM